MKTKVRKNNYSVKNFTNVLQQVDYILRKSACWDLVVQLLRLHVPNAGGIRVPTLVRKPEPAFHNEEPAQPNE